jgi:hypothetical protein
LNQNLYDISQVSFGSHVFFFCFPRGRWPGLITRRTDLASYFGIGQALSDNMRGNVLESKTIVSKFPKVVAEHLLIQVAEEMEFFDANVGTFQLALEKTPEVFHSIGVNLPINVFFRMVDNLVLEALLPESYVGHERVRVDRAASFNVSANVGLQKMFLAIAHNCGPNLTTTLKDSLNSNLVLGASFSNPALAFVGVHESRSTTNESFVYFDFLTPSAKLDGRAGLHCKANPVEHEPCGFLSDSKSASHFVGTDAVLAVRNHPHSDEPLVERQGGVLKDSADFGGELFASVILFAFPHPASGDKANVIPATSGAGNAIGPAALDHELEAIVRVGEVDDGLLESLWLGAHCVPHKTNTTKDALLSQVYYCPYKKLGRERETGG